MREKLTYVLSIIGSLFIGIIGTIVVLNNYDFNDGKVIERTDKVVSVTETNTIKSAISKIYNATILVGSYKNGQLASTGTGFVYKKDNNKGYIITNHHVIDGASEIKITNNDGQTVVGTLLGSDEYADIAIISIDVDAVLQVAELGDSTKSEVGDTLFTVGSPLGSKYMGTVTRGILSGKNRIVEVDLESGSFAMETLQTDAAINPGNSGGPLVNMNGEVIGVNSLKFVESEIEGMGFAIPIEMVKTILDRLEKGEEIVRPYLGVQLLDTTSTYELYSNRIYIDEAVKSGVVLQYVEKNKPADKAGLQKGDVIVKIGDDEVQDTSHFRYLLYKYNIGDKIKVKFYRGKDLKEATITLSDKLS